LAQLILSFVITFSPVGEPDTMDAINRLHLSI
jgi:hypothetical protein